MAERANPDLRGFKDHFFGLVKNKRKQNLFERYAICNDYIKDATILDIPCGMGRGTSLLKGYKEAYGVDISKDAIEKAKTLYPQIKFQSGNMTTIPHPENFFDVVICLEGFEHITFLEGQEFLKEAKRVLKEDGLMILSSPILIDNKFHSGNKYHLCEYKEDELVETIEKGGFSIMKTEKIKTLTSYILVLICKTKEGN